MSIRPLFTESTVVLFSDELFCIRVHQKPGPALCRHHPTPSGPSTHPLHHPFALKPLSMPRWPRRSACWAATGNDRWLVAANAAVQAWPCSGAVCPTGARPSQWPAFHPRPKHPPGAWPMRDRHPLRSQPTPHKATRKPPNHQTGKPANRQIFAVFIKKPLKSRPLLPNHDHDAPILAPTNGGHAPVLSAGVP